MTGQWKDKLLTEARNVSGRFASRTISGLGNVSGRFASRTISGLGMSATPETAQPETSTAVGRPTLLTSQRERAPRREMPITSDVSRKLREQRLLRDQQRTQREHRQKDAADGPQAQSTPGRTSGGNELPTRLYGAGGAVQAAAEAAGRMAGRPSSKRAADHQRGVQDPRPRRSSRPRSRPSMTPLPPVYLTNERQGHRSLFESQQQRLSAASQGRAFRPRWPTLHRTTAR
jgi:hypothetical protein